MQQSARAGPVRAGLRLEGLATGRRSLDVASTAAELWQPQRRSMTSRSYARRSAEVADDRLRDDEPALASCDAASAADVHLLGDAARRRCTGPSSERGPDPRNARFDPSIPSPGRSLRLAGSSGTATRLSVDPRPSRQHRFLPLRSPIRRPVREHRRDPTAVQCRIWTSLVVISLRSSTPNPAGGASGGTLTCGVRCARTSRGRRSSGPTRSSATSSRRRLRFSPVTASTASMRFASSASPGRACPGARSRRGGGARRLCPCSSGARSGESQEPSRPRVARSSGRRVRSPFDPGADGGSVTLSFR